MGSLTCGGGENIPCITGARATHKFYKSGKGPIAPNKILQKTDMYFSVQFRASN